METAAKATYDALLGLPEHARAEVIDGVVEHSPSPSPEHGRAQRTLGHLIGGPFDDDDDRGGQGGWWIIPEIDPFAAVELEVGRLFPPKLSR